MNRARSRFLLIAVAVAILLNYPILSSANKPSLVMGLPLLCVYISLVWVIAIICLMVAAGRKQSAADE